MEVVALFCFLLAWIRSLVVQVEIRMLVLFCYLGMEVVALVTRKQLHCQWLECWMILLAEAFARSLAC